MITLSEFKKLIRKQSKKDMLQYLQVQDYLKHLDL